MYTCASCRIWACINPERGERPKNCPMRDEALDAAIMAEYEAPEVRAAAIASADVEATGYARWPRLREVVEFCRRMGWRRVGMAFCAGLRSEAATVAEVLRNNGLEVVSVICKAGGHSKETIGVPEHSKMKPGQYDAMCNPIGQAKYLNAQKTDFNITVGLCVGHDSFVYRYSDALVTCLIAKDRALAHNPAGAVYCAKGYLKDILQADDETGK